MVGAAARGVPGTARQRRVVRGALCHLRRGQALGQRLRPRNRRSASATWYGPGAQLRAGVVGFGVLAVTVEGGAVAPLARDRFYFAPDETAHQIPSLAGYVGAALGARL